jgi:N-acetylglutamate synthase-like GNAT family acetyltransferase
MNIREANETDIPSIVELLKLSLGESLIPRSEAYWRWKHIDNPFGKSPVLIAEEEGQLIGVRAFMRWDWRSGEKIYKSLRAVDTATHPDHQGKGIFRQLTLQLVEKCKEEGYDFIFNTPNEKSKPGYLKMGWQSEGKYPIRILPVRPFDILFPSKVPGKTNMEPGSKEIKNSTLLEECLKHFTGSQTRTDYSVDYFRWRYLAAPSQKYYEKCSEEDGWYVFYRAKISGRRKELRICDILTNGKYNSRSLMRFLEEETRKLGMNLITFGSILTAKASMVSGVSPEETSNAVIPHFSSLIPPLKLGPELTFRPLTSQHKPTNWSPSIGDLELF